MKILPCFCPSPSVDFPDTLLLLIRNILNCYTISLFEFIFSHDGVHAPYNNADRQVAVNHVAKRYGVGVGTAFKVTKSPNCLSILQFIYSTDIFEYYVKPHVSRLLLNKVKRNILSVLTTLSRLIIWSLPVKDPGHPTAQPAPPLYIHHLLPRQLGSKKVPRSISLLWS